MPRGNSAGGPAQVGGATAPPSRASASSGAGNPLAVRAGVRADGQRFEAQVHEIAPNPRNVREAWEWDEEDFAEFARNVGHVTQLQDCTVAAVEIFLDRYPQHAGDFESHHRWVLLMGERRYRSALHNQRTMVPVVLRNELVAKGDRVFLSENNDRKGLNPLQEGLLYARLAEEEGLSYDEIASELGKGTKTGISKCVRLYKDLPEGPVRRAVHKGELGLEPAYLLLRQLKTAELIEQAYQRMKADDLTAKRAVAAILGTPANADPVSSTKHTPGAGTSAPDPAETATPAGGGVPGEGTVPSPRDPLAPRSPGNGRAARSETDADEGIASRTLAGRKLLATRDYGAPDELTTRLTTAILTQASTAQLQLAHELLALSGASDVTDRPAYLQWVRESSDAALATRLADAAVLALEELHHRKAGPQVRDDRQRVHLRTLIDQAGYQPPSAEAETLDLVSSTKH
jgi:ParB/RepB/Spo0J family partition protein